MATLRSIEVQGFRGQDRPIILRLKKDANFLIGRNGTGKTTLINLIHAALAVDVLALRSARFASIRFRFKRPGQRQFIRIDVVKSLADDQGEQITYEIYENGRDVKEYPLIPSARRTAFSGGSGAGIRHMMPTIFTRNPVRDHLYQIYKVTWLSLQRGAEARSNQEEFEEEERLSDVDHKLDQVLTELVKYFSRLDRLVAEKTEQFQKGWFLSFLANDRTGPPSIAAIDKDSERSALTAIFEKFNMAPDSYKGQLEQHLELAERAMAAYRSDGGIKFTDFLIAYDVMRLHSLVEQWQRLQESQKEIYLPKTEFIRIASDMLYRKRIDVNRSNQVIIAHDDGNKIPVSSLSSGEKQLLIFLSETLLQEQEPYLFMADEPELSLHVEWQEELVPNLLKINPNAQVLFATHSPDIVNIYQNNIHKMEELIG